MEIIIFIFGIVLFGNIYFFVEKYQINIIKFNVILFLIFLIISIIIVFFQGKQRIMDTVIGTLLLPIFLLIQILTNFIIKKFNLTNKYIFYILYFFIISSFFSFIYGIILTGFL
jgi:hypothetical protein